ncbi:4-hydroxy-tetrahydrodipicolinate synthase [Parasphingopyxis marina]|uniref:4-hydroxy-tetrahydrodipicolinate synthase n=1 Tax=Parasphingopyxis marina TaxID=2761622 RepID=A0A842HZR9_9SPHN|nr:4-hydroxy-tetrahydrodipicolinate synthase [Parasphingopyxis marina]MBC2777871.1 4-hydroxy-tetrahydrodipicolinate synthase [Parasphingopyxis marina]
MFSGSIPALVTPFRDGTFDEDAYRSLIDWQIAEGSSALVPCGTTGEAATQAFDEHFNVVRVCIEQAAGRVPVIAGCGSNDTRNAILNLQKAQELGATAGLLVPPYYNRPSQEGIYRHFEAIVGACDLPIVLYNVPSRTASDIAVSTMARLVKFPSIVGIKDATGDLARVVEQRAACGEDFCQISGNDDLALAFNAMGGVGCISVTANAAPRLCGEFQAAWAAGDVAKARSLHDRLYPLHKAMFADASPGPVKYALSKVRPGFPGELRLPMTWPSEDAQAAVDSALSHAGLL